MLVFRGTFHHRSLGKIQQILVIRAGFPQFFRSWETRHNDLKVQGWVPGKGLEENFKVAGNSAGDLFGIVKYTVYSFL